jgi:AcrR family transcriptional regulator
VRCCAHWGTCCAGRSSRTGSEGQDLAALDEAIGDFERAFSARHPDGSSPAEKLALFFREYIELMKEHPRLGDVFFSFVFSDRSDEKVSSRARDLYRRYRAMVASHVSTVAGDSRRELAAAVVGLVDGVFIQWSVEPDALDPRAAFDAFLSAFVLVEPAPGEREVGSELDTTAKGGG